MDHKHNFKKNIIAGTTYASLSTLVGFPFDTIKVKLQNKEYPTSQKAVVDIIKNKGITNFYKGSLISFISHVSKRPLQFSLGEHLKKESYFNNMGIAKNFIIGVSTGVIISPIATPFQVLKIRKQTGISNKPIISDFLHLYKNNGVCGIYKGFVPTVMRDCLFSMGLMGFYYTFRDNIGTGIKRVKIYKYEVPLPLDFISGSSAYCLTWSLLMPLDFIKTNIQKSESKTLISTVIIENFKKNGISVFWRGLFPICIKTFPVSGIAMTGYEYTRNKLEKVDI